MKVCRVLGLPSDSWQDRDGSVHSLDQQISLTLARIEQDLATMHSRLHGLERQLNLVPLVVSAAGRQLPAVF